MSYINESIIYNIYPLGFCGAPKQNDHNIQYRLDKIYDWIEHFKKLKVNAVIFNPVFESTSHGYDTIDYKKIDCRLGDNQSFKKICDTLHKNGIKVLLDGVFNHVGREFFAFKDIQQKGLSSPYCSWFQNLNFNGNSPKGDNFWYEGWAGHYDLVKLNLQNQEVVNYLIDSVRFWIDEFDIDGLRLDAADVMDINFFRQLRNFTKSKKDDFWMYGEMVGGNYNRIVQNDGLNSVTNYECFKGLYSSHNDHNYFEIAHSLQRQFSNGGIYKNIYTYNFVDNHDVNRLASTVNDQRHLKNIYTLLYCMPGVPSIYYGSEWAVKGTRSNNCDYDLRPCLDIDNIPDANNDLCSFLYTLGNVRRNLEGLKYGDFENIVIKNEQYVFRRRTSAQTVYIALNLSDNQTEVGFNTDGNFILTDVLNNNEKFQANGYINLSLPPHSSRILVANDGSFEIKEENFDKEIIIDTNSCQNNIQEEIKPIEVKPGKYRHFKGNEYEVIGIAKHSETDETMVVYKPLYNDSGLWVRPYDMFAEVIEKDGRKIHRFEPID
ncbi:MAG: DUF1653 domain-containing protein [Ruminococcus sp.]|nr:DUF1653 domain-containing protein [Ruminococcus sp.]